ncbi:MAG: recombination mediator RecR [Candidatus Nealsonbacteria bacterium]
MNYSPTIEKLIKLFSKFPTVGPKTAARFVFYLLKSKKEDIDELIDTIFRLKKNVKACNLCFNSFEPSYAEATKGKSSEAKLCDICSNPTRDKSLLCIIEKETDLLAIEKTKKYKGLYFILGGIISTLRKKDIEKIRTEELKERIEKDPVIKEIIIATNPTSEGEATALYLERLLDPFNKKITRLARGLPVGGELEYADEETLKSALEGRK